MIHTTGFVRGWIVACAAVPVFQSIGNDERGGNGGDKGLAASQRSERTLVIPAAPVPGKQALYSGTTF